MNAQTGVGVVGWAKDRLQNVQRWYVIEENRPQNSL